MSKERLAPPDLEYVDARGVLQEAELLAPRSGRRVRLHPGADQDRLVIHAPDGSAELTIRITADGPVLEVRSASLVLTAAREVTVRCEHFVVEAAGDVELSSGGDMQQRTGGDLIVQSRGDTHLEAHAIGLAARMGNVDVSANDDVTVCGERIFLNR
jgi:hypothetical protein